MDEPTHMKRDTARVVSTWLFGDFIWAMIPLVILAIVNFYLGEHFSDFFLLKEWSFASIVLFGVSIREFVHLKTAVQRGPASFKRDAGISLIAVLLIATVLVLPGVVLVEKHILPETLGPTLAVCQLLLVGLASLATFLCTLEKDNSDAIAKATLGMTPPSLRLAGINDYLADVERKLAEVAEAAECEYAPVVLQSAKYWEVVRQQSIALDSLGRVQLLASRVSANLKSEAPWSQEEHERGRT